MPYQDILALSGKERILAGFILNKLYIYKYWCGRRGRHHLGHTAIENLTRGRPRSDAGDIYAVAKRLRRWGFLQFFRAARKKHVCASRADEAIRMGLIIANEFRSSVNLPPLSRSEI